MTILKLAALCVLVTLAFWEVNSENLTELYRKHNNEMESFQMVNDYAGYANRRHDSYQATTNQIEMAAQSDCGGTFKNLQSLIQSPGYPSMSYPPNTMCEYTLRSPYVCPNEFHVQFLDFSLEPSENCERDFVQIGDGEILCGSVIGVKKYSATDGILKISFKTDDDNNERGFRLLVTRLPCLGDGNPTVRVLTTAEPEEVVVTSTEAIVEESTTEPGFFVQNGHPYDKDTLQPVGGLLPPRVGINNRQDIQPDFEDPYYPPGTNSLPATTAAPGYLPPPTNEWGPPNPYYPPSPQQPPSPCYPTQPYPQPCQPQPPPCLRPFVPSYPIPPNHNPGYYPAPYPERSVPQYPFTLPERQDIVPPTLPPFGPRQCCRNVFNQQRFYLASPGFPEHRLPPTDCIYTIQRHSPYICRLKVVFKFFRIGDERLGCVDNFVEIDGRRICGCKTGLIYTAQWGAGPKTIRLRSNGQLPQAFVFDIIQEQCPFRYTQQRYKREPIAYEVVQSREVTPTEWGHRPFASMTTNSSSLVTYYHFGDNTPPKKTESPAEFEQRAEGTSAQFYMLPGYPTDARYRCQFTFLDLVRLKAESLFVQRPGCGAL
jgi:CUB domain